ncbi:MAG: 2-succinyl-5-enolpyruvyl-6-hydroxy-3-cyclohexene-1-carboxylate synthase, partial [Bacteroidota bacterium]
LASGEPCILLTGDVAFFYDRNAFWPAAPGGGFRVIILNNKGGQIFNMIDGPRDRTEVQSFFIGDQPLDARHLCTEYGIHYIDSRSSKNPESLLEEFFNPRANATILEIFTDPDENKKTVDSLKQTIRSIL